MSGGNDKFVLSLYFIATFIFVMALQFFTLLVIFYFSPILYWDEINKNLKQYEKNQ